MKEWLYVNQIMVSRFIGTLLLVVGLGAFFWVNSSDNGVSVAQQRAAERVARMEARISRASSSEVLKQESKADYRDVYSDYSKKQMKLMFITVMLLGVGSLGYSFIKKREEP